MAEGNSRVLYRWLDENDVLKGKLSNANTEISDLKNQLKEAQTQLNEAQTQLIHYRIQFSPEGGKKQGRNERESDDELQSLRTKIQNQEETIRRMKEKKEKKDRQYSKEKNLTKELRKQLNKMKGGSSKSERQRITRLEAKIKTQNEILRRPPCEEIKRLHAIIESQNEMLRRECILKGKLAKKLAKNGITL